MLQKGQVRPAVLKGINAHSQPQELVDWLLERFVDHRMAMTTAFGMEGCALIDMLAAKAKTFRAVYVDTHFFFAETLALRDQMVERYPNIQFERHEPSLTPDEQGAQYGPRLWERDPNLCCQMRKVDPMVRVMQEVDVWVTGIRRSQSSARGQVRVVEWDWQYDLLKVNPLANWDRSDVWDYVRGHDVPYNPLHAEGYPSIGCTHCTKPVEGATIDSYSRDGRWNSQTKTECGLHGYGI